MPIPFPEPHWPNELIEEGPEEDPFIFLSGDVEIGPATTRLMAIRIRRDTLQVDFRPEVNEGAYSDLQLELMLEELQFFGDLDRTGVVTLESGSYVVWMVP